MERYTKKRRRLQQSLGDRKEHYRLYKAGKTWLIAGIATITFGVSAALSPATHVFADDETSESASGTNTDTENASGVTLNASETDSGTTSKATSTSSNAENADSSSETTTNSAEQSSTETAVNDTTVPANSESTSADADTITSDDAATSAPLNENDINENETNTNTSSADKTETSEVTSNATNSDTTTATNSNGSDATNSSVAEGSSSQVVAADKVARDATNDHVENDASIATATPDSTTTSGNGTSLADEETASVSDTVTGDTELATPEDTISVGENGTTTIPITMTRMLATTTTAAATSIDGVSTTINGGSANESGTVVYNTTTSSKTGTTVVNVSGAFSTGDVLTVTLGSNAFTVDSVASVTGATTATSTTQVNNVTEPLVTVTFNSDVSAASFDIYYQFNSNNNGDATSSLATGNTEDAVPVTVNLNGTTVATNSLVVDKNYTSTKNGTANLGYNLFNASSSTTITGGLIQNGTVVQDITWKVDLSGNRYPADYSTIPTSSYITTMSSPSTLTFTLPTTVEVTAASLDSSLTAQGMAVTQTSSNVITVTYPTGMTVAQLSKLAGSLNVSISAVTTPTTTTTYTGTTLAMTWNVDGNAVTVTDAAPSSRTTLLQYTNQTVSAIDLINFNSTVNSDLSTFDDSSNGSNQLNWQFADTSNYAYGGTLDATLNVSNSNSDTSVGIKSVSGLSDANLAKMGLSNNVSFIFTTASGVTQTVSYVSGTSIYATTIGSVTDPVTSVQVQENTAMTTPVTTTQYTPALTVGLTSYGTTGTTTVTASTSATTTQTDGTALTTATSTTSRGYGNNAISIISSNTPSSGNYYNLGQTVVINASVITGMVNNGLYSTDVALMLNDSGAAAEAYEKANPLTVVVIAPEYTSFASDAAITSALVTGTVGNGIASNADTVTITHLPDYNDRQVISISGLDNYLKGSSINVPVIVNADAPAGASIASSDTVFVEPATNLATTTNSGSQLNQLTSLGSVTADFNAGNLYNITNTLGQILGTVIASSSFNTSDSVQGSADIAAQVATGTVNVATDSATGKTILYNGTTTALTDSDTKVSLIDPTTNTQSISLTGAVTITDSTGATVTNATVTYYKDGAVVTDPTTADSFEVSNLGLASKATTTVSYNLAINSDQLSGVTTGKSWQYTTSVQSYSSGTLAANTAVALGTATAKTMTLQAVHTLTDTWYAATVDDGGNYVQGDALGTYTNVTGTVYSGTKVADITGAIVGQTMPNDANSILLGIYDVSTQTMITDPSSITLVENLASDDSSVVGSTYYVVTGPRYSTQTTNVTYTVTYTGADTVTPSQQSEQVTWTGTTDATTGTTTWVADSAINVIATPDVTGYTADAASAFSDAATTSTAEPADQFATVTYTANDETVNVFYYLEGTTNSLSDERTITGKYGTGYSTSAATVTGYTLVATPDNASGTFSTSNNDVIYSYTAAAESVTIHYVDVDGNTISADTTKPGTFGSNYTTEAETITGYTLKTTPTNANGNYTVATPDVTYVYTANTETVTVHYVDETGKTISDDTTQQGSFGTGYTTEPLSLTGYTLTATPVNAEGTYSEDTPAVTYVYKADSESATVHYYLEGTSTSLADDTTISGSFGDSYTTQPADIQGYTVSEMPANSNGTYTTETPEITYYYTPDTESVTAVYYIKGTTTPITTSQTQNGDFGSTYNTSAANVAGYTWDGTTPENATGIYGTTNDPVVYYYYAQYSLSLVDATNRNVLKTVTVDGTPGQTLTDTDLPVVEGYTAEPVTLPDTPSDVTVAYTPDTESVTVHYYQEGTTTPVATDVTLSGNYGSSYNSVAADVSGYTLTTTPANAVGTYGVTNAAVIYFYTQNAPATGAGSGSTGTDSGSAGTQTGSTGSDTSTSGPSTVGTVTAGTGNTTGTSGNNGTVAATSTEGNTGTAQNSGSQSGNADSQASGQSITTQNPDATNDSDLTTDLATSAHGSAASNHGTTQTIATTDTEGTADLAGTRDASTNSASGTNDQTANTKLPQTDENNQTTEVAETAGLGILATLVGLLGFKRKRKHGED